MKQIVAIICLMLISLTATAAKRTESQVYNDVKVRVVQIIADQTGLPDSEILENKSFVQDLKMDHQAHEAVREALSQEVGQPISIESAEKITTVQRAINFVFIRQQ